MFKNDGEYKWEDGFDNTEIASFGPSSLVVVVTTLSQLAKHQANSLLQSLFDPLADEIAKNSLQALKVFENCPAKKLLKDVRVIFPVYSFFKVDVRRIILCHCTQIGIYWKDDPDVFD